MQTINNNWPALLNLASKYLLSAQSFHWRHLAKWKEHCRGIRNEKRASLCGDGQNGGSEFRMTQMFCAWRQSMSAPFTEIWKSRLAARQQNELPHRCGRGVFKHRSEMAFINMDVGFRRKVEATHIQVWRRQLKRRRQKYRGPGNRMLWKICIQQQGKEEPTVR